MLFSTVILMMTTIVDSDRILQASIDIRQTNQSVTGKQEVTLLEQYPGHFLTTEEQRELASITYRRIPFSDKLSVNDCTDLVQNGKTSWCTISSSVSTPHACCKSNKTFVSPTTVIDIQGQNRTLAIYGNSSQIFASETCVNVAGCTFCTCEMEHSLFQGVYDLGANYKNTRYGLMWFNLPACCKCF